MLIAITQRVEQSSGYAETRDCIDLDLERLVVEIGFLPVAIPTALLNPFVTDRSNVDGWLTAVNPRGIILSGGNDIGSCLARDELERHLLFWAAKHKRPVLGICRGMQMMAVWSGTTLERGIGHVGTVHKLKLFSTDKFWPNTVNSYHNWIIRDCPSGFNVMATANDKSIEAIRHKDLPWEGCMWHPERAEQFSVEDINRLKRLFGNE